MDKPKTYSVQDIEKNRCCICGQLMVDLPGNNAWPVVPEGRCCAACNKFVVWAGRCSGIKGTGLKTLGPKGGLRRVTEELMMLTHAFRKYRAGDYSPTSLTDMAEYFQSLEDYVDQDQEEDTPA